MGDQRKRHLRCLSLLFQLNINKPSSSLEAEELTPGADGLEEAGQVRQKDERGALFQTHPVFNHFPIAGNALRNCKANAFC